MRSSFSRTGSLSGDDTSAGITTTGLMCSDRAEARRKLGGFWRRERRPIFKGCSLAGLWGHSESKGHTHLRQLGDLNEPFEVLQVAGALKQILQLCELLHEAVSVTLQGVSWKTWRKTVGTWKFMGLGARKHHQGRDAPKFGN